MDDRVSGYTSGIRATRERRVQMSEESKQRSFWERLFSIEYHPGREERVMEYITHRLHDGACLEEIL